MSRGLARLAVVRCPGEGCALLREFECPPHCSGFVEQCVNRRCLQWGPRRSCLRYELIEAFVNRTLHVIWPRLPTPTLLAKGSPLLRRKLILVTTTFPHALQLLKLEHCKRVLTGVQHILWIVAEDAATPSASVTKLLAESGIPHLHIAFGPTRNGGNAQRNQALKLIRRQRMRGVVFNMDDDNAYHPKLWDELRKLRPMRVGVFALRRGVYPPPACDGRFTALPKSWDKVGGRRMMVERPLYNETTGRFLGFAAGWCNPNSWLSKARGRRKFCLDMGAFAFDALLLQQVVGPPWNYTGHGGESELVEKLLPDGQPEDLQPLANCGLNVYVFHNEYRTLPLPYEWPRAACGTDGWGMQLSET
ncbi:hypothetical protein AB1Y20_018414 [Prymnesium parvum]|uniref:Galactosylgalactosylxylosylprotein 3-beta-glucuronosyltransferase n=1 Tax=Prymnesium parvum TaxID=97485 RepID=A0AB34JNR9_PRYPA